jgi:hypothetical protein
MEYISENIGTIVTGLIILAVLLMITVKLVKDKKAGKSICGSNCKCCPNSALCHSNRGKQVK